MVVRDLLEPRVLVDVARRRTEEIVRSIVVGDVDTTAALAAEHALATG